MNTCPVYRRSGGLAYGATYSGPIGIIIDPTFDESKFSELPFHSSLCGSCSEVCPVRINIAEQIGLWRQRMVNINESSKALHYAFGAVEKVFANPKLFRLAEKAAYYGMKLTPNWLLYNTKLNAWGKHRELPEIKKETFRDWYIKNRLKK